MTVSFTAFETRDEAAHAAASHIRAVLEDDLARQSAVTLIITGGSSPAACYALLAQTRLDWPRVRLVLSDERCVPTDHPDSNSGMIQRELLTGRAAGANLLPIYQQGLTPQAQCTQLSARLDRLTWPASLALLGMGEDGHIASLFSDTPGLEDGLDLDSPERCLAVETDASPHPRISLTLSALVQSREILLLFFGEAKQRVFENARQPGADYPVSSLIRQDVAPVRVIWAP